MEASLERAVSCSTLLMREDWKSSLNRVSWADGKSSEPKFPHDWSTAMSIFTCRIWEVSSETLPMRHRVCWMRDKTSAPGTSIAVSSSSPSFVRCCHAEGLGARWRQGWLIGFLTACCSCSLDIHLPRTSNMY